MKREKTILAAHRGAHTPYQGSCRENTLQAFEYAIHLNAQMIELDVRKTRDNVFIVYHDEKLNKAHIKELTYMDIRKRSPIEIPTMEETLIRTRGKIKLDIEVKESGYELDLMRLILQYLKEDEFVISSFIDESVKTIKTSFPRVKAGLLLGHPRIKYSLLKRISEVFPARRCLAAKADFVAPHWRLLRFGLLNRAKKHRLPVFVWTVNNRELIRKLLEDERVDAIITDNIQLAVELQKNTRNRE